MTDKELKEFLSHMTIEEKIGELTCLGGQFFMDEYIKTGPTVNLGIDPWVIEYAGVGCNLSKEMVLKVNKMRLEKGRSPILNCADVIHGYKTSFPIPLALASSFNMDLIKKSVESFTKEAYENGVNVSFAPMLDLSIDPRWGRVMESFGEDTYLGKCYADAFVKAMQGNLKPPYIGSTVKHFLGYSLPLGGRDYEMSMISTRALYDTYLPPYEKGIKAGALMVMSGFNALDYVPISANEEVLTNLLRKKIKFSGVVISDYNAIHELVNHRVAKDDKDAALIAFKAGIDVDLMSSCFPNNLKTLLDEGKITLDEIDSKVLRVLNLKNKLGLFENYNSFTEYKSNTKSIVDTAYKMSTESITLLKNDKDILPLKKDDNVLFVGPFINEGSFYSSWSLFVDKNMSTIREILKKCHYSKYDLFETNDIFNKPLSNDELNSLLTKAKNSSKVVFLIGERSYESGEAKSKADIRLNPNIISMIKKVELLNRNIISIIYSGRPLVLTDIVDNTKGLIYAFNPGTMGSKAIINLLYGKENFSSKLPISLPYSIGQIPITYKTLPTGRPKDKRIEENEYYSHYLDIPNEPLFKFGDGISYSHFTYKDLKIDKDIFTNNERINISVTVKNESNIKGKEIALLYFRDEVASITRPEKELVRFKKISLNPFEEKIVTFTISSKDLSFTNIQMKKVTEEGEFTFMVGDLSKTITYKNKK